MSRDFRLHWVGLLAATALIAAAGWIGQAQLRAWTRARVAQQYRRDIAILPERQAAALVRQLAASDDNECLEIVVGTALDSRPAVAAAGKGALLELVQRWEQSPSKGRLIHAASLASLIARQIQQLSAEHLPFAQSLCTRLLLLPVDGSEPDAAQLINDCEAVLRIPLSHPPALLLAVAPDSVKPPVATPAPAESAPHPVVVSDPPTALPATIPAALEATTAPSVADATQEPRRLISPRAIRITDEPPPPQGASSTIR